MSAMFGKHPNSKAVDHFRKLGRFSQDSPKYKETLLEVIRFAKEAIRKNKSDGDAHVLLANAYYLASLMDFPSDNYSRYLPLAAAVIFEWKSTPMYTKAKDIGDKVYYGVLEAINREIPEWMGIAKPEGTLKEIHLRYYQQALV